MYSIPRTLGISLTLALSLFSQDLKEFEKRVTEFKLNNGMKFIVLERHQAPVVSFHAYVDAGSANDPNGKNNLAHMFEHMIGKGTRTVGTTNWAAEEKALARVEQIYDKLEAERGKGPKADPAAVKTLEAELKDAIETANAYVDPNAYVRVIEEEGGVGFNASTAQDYTNYFYSLPANKTELWFLLSSDFFKRPVFREFYKERDVVREEHRMRVESSPQGKLFKLLMTTAYKEHPYAKTMGVPEDIERLRATDAEEFFRKYYAPENVTVAVVGDVEPAQIKKLAEKYFGGIPKRPLPQPITITEPRQTAERRATLPSETQPLAMIAYKRPNQRHKDDPVFDVIAGILSSGRTGILYKELVRDKKIALAAQAIATIPSGKYPNLFLFFLAPSAGKTVEENEKALYDIIERLKKEKVDEATLERVKTKLRAGVIRQLDSNSGLAAQLPSYEVNYDDWRVMFTGLQDIEKVTADDVQRVIREYFVPEARTVVYNVKGKEAGK
jgi:predicted Zn-dependent peptidase